MAFYRFTEACRQVLVNYLRLQLDEPEKHWNGTDWIELPHVHVVDAREYDKRTLPSVITDSAVGNVRSLSFSHALVPWQDVSGVYGPANQWYMVYGGRGDFDVTIRCNANDRVLQQKLTDATAAYLIWGRWFLWNYRFVLIGDIRITGDGVEEGVAQEPVYYGVLSAPIYADWRMLVTRDLVKRVDFDIETVSPADPFDLAPVVPSSRDPFEEKSGLGVRVLGEPFTYPKVLPPKRPVKLNSDVSGKPLPRRPVKAFNGGSSLS